MRKVLRMIFRNQEGRLVTLSLLDADPELTALQVETVMDSVVSRNIFTSSGGNLTEKVRAEIVTTNVLSDYS
jgi:hypothetical protein